MNPVLASVVALAFVWLPGLALYRLLGLERNRFVVATGLGVAVLVVTQLPARLMDVSVTAWLSTIVVATVVVLAGQGVYRCRSGGVRALWPADTTFSAANGAALLVAAGFIVYNAIVGGYTEVPSDFWNHLERIRWEIGLQSDDRLIHYHFSFAGLVNRDYVHSLHALVSSQLGVPRLELAETSGLVAVLLFLLSTFWFAYAVCDDSAYPAGKRTLVALAAVVLVWLWKGTTVFSFIRYYAMAPAMLGFVVYYAFLLAWLDLVRGERGLPANGFVIVFLAVSMLLMHQQELAFAVVMGALILVVYFAIHPDARRGTAGMVRGASIVAGAAMAVAGSWMLISRKEPGSVVGSKLLHLGDYVPFFEDVFILNPSRQFFMVMGWFGIAGLVLAVWRFRDIRNATVLVAGLLTPLLTVFNPAFVYLYLHLAKYETVWRLVFMLPLSLILAKILVDYGSRFPGLSTAGKTAGVAIIAAMAFLLTPMEIAGYRNTSSRFDTLVDTRPQGVEWIRDAVEYLQHQPRDLVYTDPITSYVIRSGTDHHVYGWKFYPGRSGYDFVDLEEDGELDDFVRQKSGFYVVNRRDTPNTRNGTQSGHWYDDVLTTSQWYPPGFENRLEAAGARRVFNLEGVAIYRVD